MQTILLNVSIFVSSICMTTWSAMASSGDLSIYVSTGGIIAAEFNCPSKLCQWMKLLLVLLPARYYSYIELPSYDWDFWTQS